MLGSAASAAGLLAACSPTARESASPGAAAATASQPATGETIGTGTVRVALLVPSSATGNAGLIAASLKNAATLALREFQGANLQILVKDDKGTPEGARAAAAEAISQGAELIMGPLFAPSVTAAAAVARPAGVSIVAFSTDTNVASRGVYLLSFLPQTDVDRIIGFAGSRGKHAIAALLPANGYGTVVEAALQKSVTMNGSRIVTIERYTLDRVAMQQKAEAIAAIVQKGEVDALFMPDAGDAAPFLAQILSARGVRQGQVQLLGSGQWDDPRITQESALRGGWYPAPDKSGFNAFAARYQAAFGAAPLRAASLGYDATSLAAGLAARFGDKRFTADTIANPSGFLGVDGVFRFLPDGTNQRGLAVYEVGSGTATLIDPAPKTFSRAGA
ncbi:penicillin-binding protein activator [Kaistia dalseonensis]|uniref:ABC-type branched-subunit amino acid transport system substrate-binding protein n=1 Tax=Kaistia dalseonensis TaxID=410840 RepID=A0ABU0H567_9HYPH|nr:penicillin-binding protein activator [Kaistia dalseonensis]MCX5494870.1 penicillin-binding protein activator [Kaistia dalseonensis]MDQ0437451.1 ABC-type branched-subunit amino acid transport system substrate-binding protein [Kaistia dalseonensis]